MPNLGEGAIIGGMRTIEFTLAGALRQMLDESGLRQEELAERADISKGSITNYIKSNTRPRWSTVQRWAATCGFEPDDPQLRVLWESWRPRQDSNLRPRGHRCENQLSLLDDSDQPVIDLRSSRPRLTMSRTTHANPQTIALAS